MKLNEYILDEKILTTGTLSKQHFKKNEEKQGENEDGNSRLIIYAIYKRKFCIRRKLNPCGFQKK